MFDKLKNRFKSEKNDDETAELMHKISKRFGGGAITLVDTDIALTSVRSGDTPAQHAKTLEGFRIGELDLNEMQRLAHEQS